MNRRAFVNKLLALAALGVVAKRALSKADRTVFIQRPEPQTIIIHTGTHTNDAHVIAAVHRDIKDGGQLRVLIGQVAKGGM
jgi:hypothetical protein